MRVSTAPVRPEVQERLRLSRLEAETLQERDIRCPTCGFRIQRVYSDATGHLNMKSHCGIRQTYLLRKRLPIRELAGISFMI